MNPLAALRRMALVWIIAAGTCPGVRAWEPLRVHPANPYILEFRGQPTVLVTHAEHYSSIINARFDYHPYLEVMRRDGMNLTRVFLAGFRATLPEPVGDPLDVAPENFIQPWPRVTTHGTALDGLGKWDLSAWNEDFFTRLRDFIRACGERDIVVEVTFFYVFYDDAQWRASPFHPSNNVQGIGPASRHDCYRAVDPGLRSVQDALVRRVVADLIDSDHVYYEIINEPFWDEPGVKDAEEAAFHNSVLEVIRDEEAASGKRHLVAHNFPQQAAALSAGFDIVNEHYPVTVPGTPVLGCEVLLRDHYQDGLPLALDETSAVNPVQARLEAWMFIFGGGGIYNGLDVQNWTYSEADPSGDSALGRSIRGTLAHLLRYAGDLHLTALRRDLSWIGEGVPDGATVQAMSSPGQQYVAYFHHGRSGAPLQSLYDPIDSSDHAARPVVTLDAGSWRAVWTRPADLAVLHVEEFTHEGGDVTLAEVVYQDDVALRIDRTGAGDATPPPIPGGLAAEPAADGSIHLSWQAVNAADLSSYRIYRAAGGGVPIDADHRMAEIPATETAFADASVAVGDTWHYAVTAVDANGNESAPGRESAATSARWSLPYGGVPRAVPGRIEAEDYDTGGEGVAYHDVTPANEGGRYRVDEAVDIEETAGEPGAFHIAMTDVTEWLNYSVRVADGGDFLVALRVSNTAAGARLRVEVDGVDATGDLPIPETGGADAWQTLDGPAIALAEGLRVIRIIFTERAPDATAGLLDWIEFTPVPRLGPTADAGADLEVIDEDADGSEIVALDAGGTAAGDAPVVSYRWLENGAVVAEGATPTVRLALGSHALTLEVEDGNGLTDSDTLVVTVSARSFANGGFEAGFAGWHATGNISVRSAAPYAASEGAWTAAFNDSNLPPNAVISQTFGTVPGQSYLLSFDMGVLAYNLLEQRMRVEVIGNSVLLSQTHSIFGKGGGSIHWLAKSHVFTADHATATLVIRDLSPATLSLDMLLDNVRVVPRVLRSLTVVSAPAPGAMITVSPADDDGLAGGAAEFTRRFPDGARVDLEAATMAGGLRFQSWRENGADLEGGAAISVVMDADRELTAVYAETAPVITLQPVSMSVARGGGASFHVAADGTGTLVYQWRFNGEDIEGAVSATLVIHEAGDEHAGTYDVRVSNSIGSVTSEAAEFTVIATFLVNGSFEDGLLGWSSGGNLAVQSGPPYAASDGQNLVSFNHGNSSPNGTLSQTFATTPGQTYLLDFDIGVLAYNTREQRLRVTLAGNTTLLSHTHAIQGEGGGIVRWIPKHHTFTADGAATTLVLADVSATTNSLDLLVDHFRVVPSDTRTLTVASAPAAGAAVSVTPPDENGAGAGVTGFTRIY